MIEIVNNQRRFKFDWQIFQTFAEAAIDKIPEAKNKSATIAFVSDRKMRELNKKFRGKNLTTDVLSFPFEADVLSVTFASADVLSVPQAVARVSGPTVEKFQVNPSATADGTDKKVNPPAVADYTAYFLGDIVISAEQAERQSKENDLNFELEIKQLILHGILHLCGYDHETDAGDMNALELELRSKLGIE